MTESSIRPDNPFSKLSRFPPEIIAELADHFEYGRGTLEPPKTVDPSAEYRPAELDLFNTQTEKTQ